TGPLDVLAPGRLRQLLRLIHVDLEEVPRVLRTSLVALFARDLVVVVERLLSRFKFGREHDVGVSMLCRPGDGVAAQDTGNPDRRVRLLIRARPRVYVPVVVVLALPAERSRVCPCLDDEVVGFLEALPV